jgi:16S rRNA (uracil1498-N3)-methyltransferase
LKLIATCSGETNPFNEMYVPKENSIIFVGPEGDFTQEEIELAKKEKFIPVGLGENRLRVETAGILICSQAMLLNQIKKI